MDVRKPSHIESHVPVCLLQTQKGEPVAVDEATSAEIQMLFPNGGDWSDFTIHGFLITII